MYILLTNDDGIRSQGIYALYQELIKIAKVTVVAPDRQRSSVGHAITLDRVIRAQRINLKKKFPGYAVSGTPADCVKYALHVALDQKPDLVVSGINLGPNDGHSVFYSGTVAAAREGSLSGISSVAISLNTFENPYYDVAARFCAKLTQKILTHRKRTKGLFLNVNVPNAKPEDIKGVRMTRQEMKPFPTIFLRQKKAAKSHSKATQAYQMSCIMPRKTRDKHSDTRALLEGYISITPLANNLTDKAVISYLKLWNLDRDF